MSACQYKDKASSVTLIARAITKSIAVIIIGIWILLL
jgi:hypothetical protein